MIPLVTLSELSSIQLLYVAVQSNLCLSNQKTQGQFCRDMASINDYTYTESKSGRVPCYLSLQKLIDYFLSTLWH